MRMIYLVHIAAGSLALGAGYLALYSAKGGAVHRKAGMLFVGAMLIMAVGGGLMSAIRDVAPKINIPVALLTLYLVITSLATVSPRLSVLAARPAALGMAAFALGIAVVEIMLVAEALPDPKRRGLVAPFSIFGIVAALAFIGDVRVWRNGALRGPARIARHLWRMCFALFLAALSFFIGQAQVIPKPMRIMPLLAVPVLAVLVTMFYWLWRVRRKRSLRGLAIDAARAVPAAV